MKFRPRSEVLDSSFVTGDSIQELMSNPAASQVLDTLPDGLIIVDRQGLIIFMNSAAESINELDADRLTGVPLLTFCKESIVNCDVIVDSFRNELKINTLVCSADGTDVLVTTRFLRDKYDEVAYFIITQRNLEAITKLIGSESQSLSNFKTLSESIGDRQNDLSRISSKLDEEEYLKNGLRAMQMKSRIILTGESGAGKTEAARYLHQKVIGNDKPFIHVNCSSIPESLFESEMFGYERGAFTGANQRGKKGLIEAANGGTLFLDEVGEVPMLSQPKLLQFIEEGTVQRLGATTVKKVRVNLITATNRDLKSMVQQGLFRQDLYYRISVIQLHIPSLRERRELIPELIKYFVKKMGERREKPFILSPACTQRLLAYDYPGNIRELQNVIEQLAVACDDVAEPHHLPVNFSEQYKPETSNINVNATGYASPEMKNLKDSVREFEAEIIRNAICCYGSKRKAAEALGVDIATIVRKTK